MGYLKKNESEHSELIYGRTSENYCYFVKNIYEKQKLIIAELKAIAFNTWSLYVVAVFYKMSIFFVNRIKFNS